MKIAVLGAGNIGTLLAAKLSLSNNIILFTSNIEQSDVIDVYDKNNCLLFKSNKVELSNNYANCLLECDMIFVTYPSNVWATKKEIISNYINKNAIVIFVPAMGGKEYISDKIRNNNSIIGFQRVPYISRIKEKGKSVYMLDEKKQLFLSAINLKDMSIIKSIEKSIGIKCIYIENYLNLTLTPSNPILHTTRLFSIFSNNKYYDYEPLFYQEWDIASSDILFKCDAELQQLCKILEHFDLSHVKSLKDHYESYTEQKLVDKITNIESFKGIKAPVKKIDNKFYPDYTSRYFLEDFPFGLLIIKGFALICNINTPNIDKVIMWEQENVGKEYLINGKLNGKDIKETGIPQNFGINTIKDIYEFYGK